MPLLLCAFITEETSCTSRKARRNAPDAETYGFKRKPNTTDAHQEEPQAPRAFS